MQLAIMQPYLFPYLGYFQLIHACDEFVVFDDVQYIKRGWVNRNSILLNGTRHLFTAPVSGASQLKTFNEVSFAPQPRLLRTILQAYRRAPEFDAVYPMIECILAYEDRRVAPLVRYSLERILEFIQMPRVMYYASGLRVAGDIRGQTRILEICRIKGATGYVNLPGGAGLYQTESFAERGVNLSFLHPKPVSYKQFDMPFVANLSIIDLLMFNKPAAISNLLHQYELKRA